MGGDDGLIWNEGAPRRLRCTGCGGEGVLARSTTLLRDDARASVVHSDCSVCRGAGYLLRCPGCGRYRPGNQGEPCGCGSVPPEPWGGDADDQRCRSCAYHDIDDDSGRMVCATGTPRPFYVEPDDACRIWGGFWCLRQEVTR